MRNLVLEAETATCMRLLGAKNISELGPRFVSRTNSEQGRVWSPRSTGDLTANTVLAPRFRSILDVWRETSTTGTRGWTSGVCGQRRNCSTHCATSGALTYVCMPMWRLFRSNARAASARQPQCCWRSDFGMVGVSPTGSLDLEQGRLVRRRRCSGRTYAAERYPMPNHASCPWMTSICRFERFSGAMTSRPSR